MISYIFYFLDKMEIKMLFIWVFVVFLVFIEVFIVFKELKLSEYKRI